MTVQTVLLAIDLPTVPAAPLSMNEAKGMHWRKVRDRCDPWRDTVAWLGKQHRRTVHALIAEHGRPLAVRVTIPFAVDRRRDAHNYTGTVVKAVIDGLQIAGWIADDTPEWVTVLDPILTVGGNPRIELVLS